MVACIFQVFDAIGNCLSAGIKAESHSNTGISIISHYAIIYLLIAMYFENLGFSSIILFLTSSGLLRALPSLVT